MVAHKLVENGVVCSIATNNVLNPFTPFGDASLLRMANFYANVAHAGISEFDACLDLVTELPARLMNLRDYGIAPGNPADPQVRARTEAPPNLLARDETTLAIEKELSQTENTAKSSESMEHEGMQHEGMKMQHGEIYTCPMHPQIKSDKPGKCPICGMTLKKKEGRQ